MKKKRWPVQITREVSYVEVVDAEIIADDADEAYALGVAIANGGQVDWPALHRYNTVDRAPVDHVMIAVQIAEDEDIA